MTSDEVAIDANCGISRNSRMGSLGSYFVNVDVLIYRGSRKKVVERCHRR